MNPFDTLKYVQDAYLTYVETFQKFKNPVIRDWVKEQVRQGTLLWKEPYIEISRRFAQGESFDALVADGLLHPATAQCFTRTEGDRLAPPILPYRHQTDAVRSILAGHNTIVATGTGSGKSFCFGLPIVSEALRLRDQGAQGIKAVIVYPMNALANSQYKSFAHRLAGSGLKLALYTGDTKNSPEEALKQYQDIFGRDKPYDSELLSRDEIRKQLPDILMTNYVQLELLLTRFEDLVLFPQNQRGALRFLVLDEIHTYTGKRGADVACLIRRLKQHTGTIGKLRCIGTSATVESGEGEDARAVVANFASTIFGEPFDAEHVIGESYAPLPDDLAPLTRQVAEALAPGAHTSAEVAKRLGLSPDQVEQALSGTPGLQPKLHAFFSQGRAISACLRSRANDCSSGPHLNDHGEITCPVCAHDGHEGVPAYPMYFCRACGQEFYSVGLAEDGTLHAREHDALEFEGAPCYIYPGRHDSEEIPLPENWLTPTGNLKKEYQKAEPENRDYCLDCNRIVPEEQNSRSAAPCGHKRTIPVCVAPAPLLLCPSCGITYDRRVREFNKLFTFGTVGRSTATDVLIANTLAHLPEDERKVIAFSDNRQDTALQAAHINNLQKRLVFRRALYHTLLSHGCTDAEGEAMDIGDVGLRIFETQQAAHVLPEYRRDRQVYGIDRQAERRYQQYLQFAALRDLESTQRLTNQNLEDAGLLFIQYNGLADFAADQKVWDSIPGLAELDSDRRYDYLLGFLDIMRKRLALHHEAWLRPVNFRTEVLDRLSEEAFFHSAVPEGPVGFSDEEDVPRWGATAYRFTGKRTSLMTWTRRALGEDSVSASDIIPKVVHALADERAAFLQMHEGKLSFGKQRVHYSLYMINPDKLLFQASERTRHLVCPKCGVVHQFKKLRVCNGITCGELQENVDLGSNYFRGQYNSPLADSVTIVAGEHSGQLSGDARKQIEVDFQNPEHPLNVIVCTPTMELGIDIGDLSAIYMRNVPPSPSHYAQRAGRAGRNGQPSLITVFCGVGAYRGPHDQYFYRFPEKIIAGRIAAPRFLLDNQNLITTHIRSLVLETLGRSLKLSSHPYEILDLDDVPTYPLRSDWQQAYRRAVQLESSRIIAAVQEAFAGEMKQYRWLDETFVHDNVTRFVDDINSAFERWRAEYRQLTAELNEINRKLGKEGPQSALNRRRVVIEQKLEDMRGGKKDWYVYRYLGGEGFLPNYAFPRRAAVVSFYESEDELTRDPAIALNEYAPGNSIYFRGDRYEVTHARPRTKELQPDLQALVICPDCQSAYLGESAKRAACSCGRDLRSVHPHRGLIMPDVFARRRARITADEEERLRLGYVITNHYQPGDKVQTYVVAAGGKEALRLAYEHNAQIISVNQGPRQAEPGGQPSGFTLCAKCNRWLVGENEPQKHIDPKNEQRCSQQAGANDLIREMCLYSNIQTDVMTVDIPLPQDRQNRARQFYTTMLHTWLQGVSVALNLGENELRGFLAPAAGDANRYRIILFEVSEGGAGALASLSEPARLGQVIARAREILHEQDPEEEACERACYDCLLSFYNQLDHELMDRQLVLPFLQSLGQLTIEPLNVTPAGHTLVDLMVACQSDLERHVLQAIHDGGLPLPDAAQKTIYDGDAPIAIADFFYEPRTVLFVDGSPHYRDYVIAGDEAKRKRLKALNYRVLAITGDTLAESLDTFKSWLV